MLTILLGLRMFTAATSMACAAGGTIIDEYYSWGTDYVQQITPTTRLVESTATTNSQYQYLQHYQHQHQYVASTAQRQAVPDGKEEQHQRRYTVHRLSSGTTTARTSSNADAKRARTATAKPTQANAAAAAATTMTPRSNLPSVKSALDQRSELVLTMRLVFSALAGAAVGTERRGQAAKSRNHHAAEAAGVRTMALVSLGAALFTVCSMYGFFGIPNTRYDPSRMASNVASGVGFVGAGVITTTTTLNQKQQQQIGDENDPKKKKKKLLQQQETFVHGLTTAAAIWLSAAVGVASGAGLYYVASAGAALTIGILRFGRPQSSLSSTAKEQERQRRQPQLLSNQEVDDDDGEEITYITTIEGDEEPPVVIQKKEPKTQPTLAAQVVASATSTETAAVAKEDNSISQSKQQQQSTKINATPSRFPQKTTDVLQPSLEAFRRSGFEKYMRAKKQPTDRLEELQTLDQEDDQRYLRLDSHSLIEEDDMEVLNYDVDESLLLNNGENATDAAVARWRKAKAKAAKRSDARARRGATPATASAASKRSARETPESLRKSLRRVAERLVVPDTAVNSRQTVAPNKAAISQHHKIDADRVTDTQAIVVDQPNTITPSTSVAMYGNATHVRIREEELESVATASNPDSHFEPELLVGKVEEGKCLDVAPTSSQKDHSINKPNAQSDDRKVDSFTDNGACLSTDSDEAIVGEKVQALAKSVLRSNNEGVEELSTAHEEYSNMIPDEIQASQGTSSENVDEYEVENEELVSNQRDEDSTTTIQLHLKRRQQQQQQQVIDTAGSSNHTISSENIDLVTRECVPVSGTREDSSVQGVEDDASYSP